MRGIAAIAVVTLHTESGWGPAFALPGSYLAVDLFFLLSGFVLAHAYDRRFAEGMGVGEFMKKRLVRLYPLYLLGCTASVVGITTLWLLHAPTPWTSKSLSIALVFNSVFLPTPNRLAPGCSYFALLFPAWSLFLELFVNILFAAFWKLLRKEVLIAFCAIAGIALVVSAIHYGSLDVGWRSLLFAGGLARILFEFPLGVFLYRHARGISLPEISPWLCFAALIFVFWVPAAGTWRIVFDVCAVSIVLPAILLAGSAVQPNGWQLRLFLFVGAISYAVYILHGPIVDFAIALTMFAEHAGPGQDMPLTFARYAPYPGIAILALTMVVAALAHRFYDVPLRKALSGYEIDDRFRRIWLASQA